MPRPAQSDAAARALAALHTAVDSVDVPPAQLRDGLVTVLLRLVFLLLAEARDLVPRGLAALRRHADPWPALLAVFDRLSSRGSRLFAADRHPFLATLAIPATTIHHVLEILTAEPLHIEHLGRAHESLLATTERRNAGAHYTPRTLTASIVATTLRPILAAFGEHPTPAQILAIKLCDPAMGSGAFLLEATLQLAALLPGPDARRQVAHHCIHGVDSDPIAVDLARLSLWLLTDARDRPFHCFDTTIQQGDSLVGLSNHIAGSHHARAVADAAIHTFFATSNVHPFHWPLEFPAVFTRDNPGFDCFVGNPPFLGGKRVRAAYGPRYGDWCKQLHPGTTKNADLVAHFFRRAFTLLRARGTLGFLTTNSIAQGATRDAGLRWLCQHGAEIYAADTRIRWPGAASVIVSAVHLMKGPYTGERVLDGAAVPTITAFLLPRGGHDDPHRLAANAALSAVGSLVLGMGFTFDDTSEAATPLAAMHSLIMKDPRNAERIAPFIGGEEINASPTQAHHRYIIDFEERSEAEARAWPDLMHIVEARVRPERITKPGSYASQWWLYGRRNQAGRAAMRGLSRVLVSCQVGPHLAFVFQPTDRVFAHTLNLFMVRSMAGFAVLQSRVHEVWARCFGSSMRDDLRYTPSDCFETFPLPPDWLQGPDLERAGQQLHETRAAVMRRRGEGLTRTYNRFHDPDELSADILELRTLHAEVDRAVLTAYGWSDLAARAGCEFRLDHPGDAPPVRPRRAPWRHRWPRPLHDEVLARLLALNEQRAAAERRA